MTRGIRIRIVIFVALSALGIVYVSSTYLGVVDALLGRGYSLTVTLPKSGGLYVGSSVTYRGVQVGEVEEMSVTASGARVHVHLDEGTRIPTGSRVEVHNLSAVGEQYLDFQPETDEGPYLEPGATVAAGPESLPVPEDELLIALHDFVTSVDQHDLSLVIEELGNMFRNTGVPLQELIDGGSAFVAEAAANEEATTRLLRSGLTVLRTQKQQGENIEAFSRNLRQLTDSLRRSDRDLDTTLRRTPAAIREVDKLLTQLEPTIPVFLANAITVNQVVVAHLAGVEQLLVTFPAAIATGFTGTTPDGYGHVNLQFDQSPAPCREGYMPPSQWRNGHQTEDHAIYPARCLEGPPVNMRGSKYAPAPQGAATTGRAYRGSYDPATGLVEGVVDEEGNPVRFGKQGNLSIMGGDAWKWLLVGPVARR